MAGEIVRANDGTNLMNKINSMRAKWGISGSATTFTAGQTSTSSSQINSMIDWINEGKNKSGWSGSVSPKVNAGDLLKNIIATLSSTADQITAHCPCNCNHCSCNCNRCSCNCDNCDNCHVGCDSTR